MNRRWALLGLGGLLALPAAGRAIADEHERFEVHERQHENFPRPDFEEPSRFDERAEQPARWDERQRAEEQRRLDEQQRDQPPPLDEGWRFREGRQWQARRADERHHFTRPRVEVETYTRRYAGLPEFRRYGSWGLVAPLKPYADLAFLSDALLVGSYVDSGRVIYLYLIDEDGA